MSAKARGGQQVASGNGTAGEALIVSRQMFTLGALAKAESRPLPLVAKSA